MAKQTIWTLREPDGFLNAFSSMKELKESIADWTMNNSTKGMEVAEYGIVNTIPIKSLVPKEKK